MKLGTVMLMGTLSTLLMSGLFASGSKPASPPPKEPPDKAPGKPGGAKFFAQLATSRQEREKQILEQIAAGNYDVDWAEVTSTLGGRTLKIPVFRRALAIGQPGDRLIVPVSFTATQQIADLMNAHMLTSKVADLIWLQAGKRITPITRGAWVKDGTMGHTSHIKEQSDALEAAVGGEAPGIVANEGKQWVITRRHFPGAGSSEEKQGIKGSRHNAANFGWHGGLPGVKVYTSPGGQPVVQPVGLAHDRLHVDYSQLVMLMGAVSLLDGVPTATAKIAADEKLAALISDEGPLPDLRHPDLPALVA